MTRIRVLVQKECKCEGTGCNDCGGSGWLELPPMVQEAPGWMFEKQKPQNPKLLRHDLRSCDTLMSGVYICSDCGVEFCISAGVATREDGKGVRTRCCVCYNRMRDRLEEGRDFFLDVHPDRKGYILMAPNKSAHGAFHHEPHQEMFKCKHEGCVPMQGRE